MAKSDVENVDDRGRVSDFSPQKGMMKSKKTRPLAYTTSPIQTKKKEARRAWAFRWSYTRKTKELVKRLFLPLCLFHTHPGEM